MEPPYVESHVVAPPAKSYRSPQTRGLAFHPLMSWLKELAPLNIPVISLTLLVSAQERGAPPLLKAVAPKNI